MLSNTSIRAIPSQRLLNLKKAIESNGGIKGVRVTIEPVPKIAGRKKIKWDGISSLSNFVITSAGERSFKAYGIGAGHFQSWTSFKGSTDVGRTSVSEGWAGRDPKRTGHRFSAKQRTFLENKFNDGVKTGVKANPDNVSKEMRQLKDQNGKRVCTVVEFLRAQQISSYFSRMASTRKGATESDDEAE
ncbi:Hypothetical predicted protein [Paramuricea clavata]|uniref:Uncharacterized protein n=1 Tax=Paramuricea clavata TaxID=317549 RepID=A0A6S7HMS0_PARCT|nr:Hypothetical predicted protein [Paramuricea clavata]